MKLSELCQLAECHVWLASEKEKNLPVEFADRNAISERISGISMRMNEDCAANREWIGLTDKCLHHLKEKSGKNYMESLDIWLTNYHKKISLLLVQALVTGEVSSMEESKTIASFLLDSQVETNLKALGLYLNGAAQDEQDPVFAYYFMSMAFQMDPQVAKNLGSDYVFQSDCVAESYADQCPICGCEESTPYYCVKQFVGLGKGSTIFSPIKLWAKCEGCGNLYAYNFPESSMGEINGHYTRNASNKGIRPKAPLYIYGDILNRCAAYAKGTDYLEVGVGDGGMLATALELGYNVDAVEICREDCELISGILGVDIRWADFLDCNLERTYDIIVMGDVLEHVPKPVEALKKAYTCLNESGVLFLSTPNLNSGYSRLMKFQDPMMNQKNHFTYFTYEGLKPILEEVGFSVRRYDVSSRYNGSMELYCVKNKRSDA